MIIKSMSRKEPSFEQLVAYMSSEKADARYDMHHNCFSRRSDDLAREFLDNARLLSKRKGGNYLYHEIVSISVGDGVDRATAKKHLREISRRYIEARSPRNMVFGCLHEDHSEHLHYHLLISANERGERSRTRLTQRQFDSVKRDLEKHVLLHFPELKQTELINAVSSSEKMSVKAGELKRRSGNAPERDEVKTLLKEAMEQSATMDEFCSFVAEQGFEFYTRGKNFGVQVSHESGKTRKYRFSTLGVHEEFETFQARALQAKPEHVQAAAEDEAATSTNSDEEVVQGYADQPRETQNTDDAEIEKIRQEFDEQTRRQKDSHKPHQKDQK